MRNVNNSASVDAQMKKGVLEMCVLHAIKEQPTYGYDIMKQIRQLFPEVNDSTVYVILRRLAAESMATATVQDNSGGPPRKYYHITEAGAALLLACIAAWRRVNDALARFGIEGC